MKKVIPVILLLILLAVGTGYWWYERNQVPVDETNLVLYGNVDVREVRLAFNGSEHVAEMLVNEGDRVKIGQLLARLHTERIQASLDRARADANAIKAEAHVAQLSYQRIRKLAAKNLASKEEKDEAQGKNLAAAARVVAAEAAVAEYVQVLQDTKLFSPVNGVVRERIVEVGDFVTPQTPVLTLSLLNPIWVRTYLPESYLGRVRPGAIAYITTDSYPGKKYRGWIGSISPTAEFTPKNIETPDLRSRLVYQVRVYACNPQSELRLGMPATVEIALDQEVSDKIQPEERCSGGDGQ